MTATLAATAIDTGGMDGLRREESQPLSRPDEPSYCLTTFFGTTEGRKLSNQDWHTEVISRVGADLGRPFCRLSDEVAVVHFTWRLYRELFLNDANRRALMGKAAPGVFSWVEFFMRDHILLQLCRLTDPAKTRGQENLTFASLEALADVDLKAKLRTALCDVKSRTKFARDHRNKQVAHLDKITALEGGGSAKLRSPAVQHVDDALSDHAGVSSYRRESLQLGSDRIR